MSPRARLAALVALGISTPGCPELPPHVCRDDADCNRKGQAGICFEEACGYPDASCPSAYAYSPNADVATERCVPATCSTLEVTLDAGPLDLDEALLDYPLLVRLPESASELGPPTSITLEGVSLPFEVAAGAGPSRFYVRLPRLAPDAMMTLEVGFGQPDASSPPASDVWSAGYQAVWHFDDPLTGAQGASLANAVVPEEIGELSGEMGAQDSVPGVIGRAVQFDGADDSASFRPEFLGELDAFTVTMWARVDVPDEGAPRISYFEGLNGDSLYPRCWRAEDLRAQCQLRTENAPDAITLGGDGPRSGRFAHLAFVRDAQAQTLQIFLDGTLIADTEAADASIGGNEALEIARGQWGFSAISVDEVRVSDRALPPSWLRADVRTQLDSDAVLRVSEGEAVRCDP